MPCCRATWTWCSGGSPGGSRPTSWTGSWTRCGWSVTRCAPRPPPARPRHPNTAGANVSAGRGGPSMAGRGRPEEDLAASVRTIERAAGALATASVARMDDVLPWFRELPADQRAWVMLVAQAGVQSFVEWLRESAKRGDGGPGVSDEIFDAAPRALARSITLQQTVQLIQVTIGVVEEQVPRLAAPGEERAVTQAMLRFSREVAFAAARVYARAAESRGTWDARLQAQLVDALLRGDSSDELASRAAALGWADARPVAVAVGRSPGGEAAAVLHVVHRAARRLGVDVLGGVH